MNAKKILFATDFSPASEAALKFAEMLARDTLALLLIVHVQEQPIHYDFGEMPDANEDYQSQVTARLNSVLPSDLRVRFVHRLVHGLPATEIIRLAEMEHVDLIVMGTHGRTGLMHLLMGSVSEQVVRRAPCPVLTLRDTATVATQEAPLATA